MNRKIVFVNQATGYLTIDILNQFVKEFDQVALITGSVRVQDDELDKRIEVSKICRYNRGSSFYKALSWLWGTVQIYLLLISKYRHYEKVFFTIPPTAYLLPLSGRKPISLVIYDLYPEALKINGISEDSWLYRWWGKKNNKLFKKAHKIYTLSDNMKAGVLNYCSEANVVVIPNWSAFSEYNPIEKSNNRLIKKEGHTGKFIVQYSGNIGATHNVETIVELAEEYKGREDIVFQIIGRGKRTEAIAKLIQEKGLGNCLLLPFRDDALLYESLCAADLAIVTLDDKTPDVSVPSKTYNLMAAGIPIIGIAANNSGISAIVKEYEIGGTFEKEDLSGMTSFINGILEDQGRIKALSEKSLQASKHFSNKNAEDYLKCYQ